MSPEIITAVVTAVITLASAVVAFGRWFTNHVDRVQESATLATKAIESGLVRLIDEQRMARTEFLAGLEKVETRHEIAEGRMLEAVTSLQEILRERGIPAKGGIS